MNGSRTRMPLGEFLASDCLSRGNLKFDGEIEGEDGSGETKLLRATKLALLLAKAFAKAAREEKATEPEASLQLDSFFVRIQLEGTSESEGDQDAKGATRDGKCNSGETGAAHDGPSDPFCWDERGGEDDIVRDPDFHLLLSTVFDDCPDQDSKIGYAERDDPRHPGQGGRDGAANYSNFYVSASEALDGPVREVAGDAPDEAKIPPTTSEPQHSPNMAGTTWINIVGIDFQAAPSDRSSTDAAPRDDASPIRTLGSHLHAIFAGDDRGAPSLVRSLPSPSLDEGAASMPGERPPRQPPKRGAFGQPRGDPLFATLLETGRYPAPVCRLLSDAIGAGEGGKGEDPFASLDEVVRDLEQMASHPQAFLHDQGVDFSSSKLHFGRRCYGRVGELTALLEVSTRLEQAEGPSPRGRSEAVFVSGVAGSGKSHFVRNVGGFLKNLGWTVLGEKFKREMEHSSREIVSSLFEKLVAGIVETRSSTGEADVDFCRQVARAISEKLDPAHLSGLANFIPSIKELLPKIDEGASSESDMSLWQLVFLLSELMKAVLGLGWRILMCLDDLQWCNSTMLTLIKEIVVSVGQDDQGRRHFLLVGMYRHDEISQSHPLADQLASLRECSSVQVTEIKLSSLSPEEVADMLMYEMRLPRRLISGLAQVIHKKTSGHAIFVVQVLNSLVRESTIAYSPLNRRFDWDESKIASLRMGDSVASLIVSSLSSLQVKTSQSLSVLSCFGVQVPLPLIKFLAKSPCVPEGGIEFFLPGLIDRGIVDISGQSVFFSHDLIQQHVYENIPIEERRRLHLDIGTFIASEIALDSSLTALSTQHRVEDLTLDEYKIHQASASSPMLAIATNQVNFAGPDFVLDRPEQIRFARWNLQAGKDAAVHSNFQAALHYYKSGTAFLGDGLWLRDCHQLCHDLHEGSASAYFAIGDHFSAIKQANVVIDNVPFHDSLVSQYILIRSLDNLGRYLEAVSNGLELLRLLKIDIPSEPSPSAVSAAMAETVRAVSAHSFDQITNTRHIVDAKKRSVMKCANALVVSFHRSASPYLPIVGCAVVNYSLQNGICEESASAFFIFGYFKTFIFGKNYKEGRYWGNVVMKLLEGATDKASLQADAMCTYFLNVYFYPFKESARRLMDLYKRCTAIGDFEIGLRTLNFSLILFYYGGEKLSLILNYSEELITMSMKHSKENTKLCLVNKLLIEEVVGSSSGVFPDFGGLIDDEKSLLFDAQTKNNFLLIEAIHVKRLNTAFWVGDYTEARKCSQAILALPTGKMPKITLVFHDFFMGLIAFQMYRDGKGEEHLNEGKKALDKMEVWNSCSTANFINKLLLLQAEHHASMCNMNAAKAAYEASVKSARDHGLVHEQGLACELYGKFLSSVMNDDEALCWLKCAHACYVQWGAKAKAEKMWKDLKLGSANEVTSTFNSTFGAIKHGRDENELEELI